MKMIMVVVLVRVIVNMFEKKKNVTEEKKQSRNRIIHPAEFEVR